MVRKSEKREKWEMHTVGPGLWQGNFKKWKRRHKHGLPGLYRKTLKNVKNQKYTIGVVYGEKTENHGNVKQTLQEVKYGTKCSKK